MKLYFFNKLGQKWPWIKKKINSNKLSQNLPANRPSSSTKSVVDHWFELVKKKWMNFNFWINQMLNPQLANVRFYAKKGAKIHTKRQPLIKDWVIRYRDVVMLSWLIYLLMLSTNQFIYSINRAFVQLMMHHQKQPHQLQLLQ